MFEPICSTVRQNQIDNVLNFFFLQMKKKNCFFWWINLAEEKPETRNKTNEKEMRIATRDH